MALLLASSAAAQSMNSSQVAIDLGTVLASEDACGLTYDQAAITGYIEDKVEADDMSFPSTLQMMTESTRYDIEDMSTSSLTAHCAQIRRIAKSYNFVD
ncbi:MAG: signal recognition particle [Alphaproteobacteria bacterium]|nr:signal recognition particle [Alphaproteobacteria bacterium]